MLIDIVKFTRDWILEHNTELNLKDGLYLCRKDAEKGVLYKPDNEYDYSGIDDRRGNFFYIRFQDEESIEYSEPEKRYTSCNYYYNVTANLRLICVMEDWDDKSQVGKYEIENSLKKTLEGIDFSFYIGDELKIRINITKSLLNPIQILKEESGKVKNFKDNYAFVAIDFNLSYITENCIDMGCVNFCLQTPSGNIPGILKITQDLTLGDWNTVTHNIGSDYEVYNIELKTSANENIEIDNWEIVDDNSYRIRPAGVGVLSDVQIFTEYRKL